MATFIDFNDQQALDDRQLQDTWKTAKAEYDKYHSLKSKGGDLQDFLTPEELDEVRRVQGLPVKERNEVATEAVILQWRPVNTANDESKMPREETMLAGQDEQLDAAPAANTRQQQTTPAAHPALPQALLGSIKDEAMQNLMMSWFYAGYYTGYYDGQQKAASQLKDAKES